MPQSVADESHGEAHLPSEMPVSSRRDDDGDDMTRGEERSDRTVRQNQPETDFAKAQVENVRGKKGRVKVFRQIRNAA